MSSSFTLVVLDEQQTVDKNDEILRVEGCSKWKI